MPDPGAFDSSRELVDPGPSLGEMVKYTRLNWRGLSLRALARETNISAGQLSRIESGETPRPSIKTLLVLAPALELHPSLLLALAGHLDATTARRELAQLVTASRRELIDEYDDEGSYADELLTRAHALAGEDAVRELAMELATLVTQPVGAPPELHAQPPAGAPDRDLLAQLIACWQAMTPDRRWRLLQSAKDFAAASSTPAAEHSTDRSDR